MPGFDYGVIPLAEPKRLQEVVPAFFAYAGQSGYLSGLAKLSQSVMVLLTTERGSVTWDPEFGASPVKAIQRNGSLTKDVVDNAIAESTQQIEEQIRAWNGSQASDDERIGDLVLTADEADFDQGRVNISVSLRSVAGDAATYAVTFSVPIE